MTPEGALEFQVECYRKMTGEQRLERALELHILACDFAREGIRRQFPNATEEEVDQHLRERIKAAANEERKGNVAQFL
jgi:hypothetical protein